MCYIVNGKQAYRQEKGFSQRKSSLQKGVTLVVLKISLSKKVLMEVECNLGRVGN